MVTKSLSVQIGLDNWAHPPQIDMKLTGGKFPQLWCGRKHVFLGFHVSFAGEQV